MGSTTLVSKFGYLFWSGFIDWTTSLCISVWTSRWRSRQKESRLRKYRHSHPPTGLPSSREPCPDHLSAPFRKESTDRRQALIYPWFSTHAVKPTPTPNPLVGVYRMARHDNFYRNTPHTPNWTLFTNKSYKSVSFEHYSSRTDPC